MGFFFCSANALLLPSDISRCGRAPAHPTRVGESAAPHSRRSVLQFPTSANDSTLRPDGLPAMQRGNVRLLAPSRNSAIPFFCHLLYLNHLPFLIHLRTQTRAHTHTNVRALKSRNTEQHVPSFTPPPPPPHPLLFPLLPSLFFLFLGLVLLVRSVRHAVHPPPPPSRSPPPPLLLPPDPPHLVQREHHIHTQLVPPSLPPHISKTKNGRFSSFTICVGSNLPFFSPPFPTSFVFTL